ncbi:MAG: hypothetical protein PHI48_13200, partial [Bacteroidales bacterium]|nr:hypothetical protein [Bacteroidales bacterium]MDD4823498.1 hypothetical protein [Bacteroidales bacterium]
MAQVTHFLSIIYYRDRESEGNKRRAGPIVLCQYQRFSESGKKKSPSAVKLKDSQKRGGYLLSHNKCTTIGVTGLNFSVRNGK